MKVLLIDPPDSAVVYGRIGPRIPPAAPSLGLAYVAAVLEKNDIPVELLDARGKHLEFEDIENKVREHKPDIVGITSTTPVFGMAIEIARRVKRVSDDITVMMGGPHLSATPIQTLKERPFVDIVVVGEGEYTALEIAQGKNLDDIQGIAFRKNGIVVLNEKRPLIADLDSIPFPVRRFYDLSNYHQPLHELYGGPITTVLSSRGCPFNCSFCGSKIIFGRGTRFRSMENIMEEIDLLMREYGIKGIKFADDTFTLRPTRLRELCRDLKRRSLFWIGNARADTLDREMLIMIRDSGCALLQIGVESGVPEILEQLQKGITVEQVRRVFKWTNEVGIDTLATFIFGAPAETRDTVEQTIQLAKEIRPTYANFFIMSPYPDSDIYRYMASRDMIAIDDWAKVKSPKYENYIINHPNFSSKQLKQIQSRAYREFYFNPDYIFSSLFKLNSWSKLRGVVKLALTIFDFTRH